MDLLSSFHILAMTPIDIVPDLDEWGNDELETILDHFGEDKVSHDIFRICVYVNTDIIICSY